jgi:hypothetical protein
MERDDLQPLRARIGLVFEPVIVDRICELPIAEPEIDRPAAATAEIVQDRSVATFFPQGREPEIRMPVRINVFSLDSEPQPDDRVVSASASERTSESAVFKIKTRKRSHTV